MADDDDDDYLNYVQPNVAALVEIERKAYDKAKAEIEHLRAEVGRLTKKRTRNKKVITDLRNQNKHLRQNLTRVTREKDLLKEKGDGKLLARIDAVMELHTRNSHLFDNGTVEHYCEHCSDVDYYYVLWPCQTVTALTPEESQNG